MVAREDIESKAYEAIADAFMLDVAEVQKRPDLHLREDLGASSMQYYPLIATLEDAFGVALDFHEFQNEARTVQGVVDFTQRACDEQLA